MAQVVPELRPNVHEGSSDRWMAVIFNNETNSMDEVIEILMIATGCGLEEASLETWEADAYGKAPVHFASEGECRRVCDVLSTIGLQTEVAPEWNE